MATKKSAKIRLAAVGMWGKGFSDWLPMYKSGRVEMVAFCDAGRDAVQLVKDALKKQKIRLNVDKIPFYDDYRKLLADAEKLGIQAMTVSTPDHLHAAVAIPAMKKGIHVYVQKPLVRTLWELDYFRKTAKENGVVTQLGNQGSGLPGLRRATEVLQSGLLGDVKEVHVWTNRPVWPQGQGAADATKGRDKVPEDLNWDAWVGPLPKRNFKGAYKPGKKGYDPWNLCDGVYHRFSWRAFTDFGCGAFGDMACHTMNLPFRGLELGPVKEAECLFIEEKVDGVWPMKSKVRLTYAARMSKARPGVKLPKVDLYWYDGRIKPDAKIMPQVTAAFKGEVPETGCVIIGSKGILCSTNDYGGDSFVALAGEKKVKNMLDHRACKKVPTSIPRLGGESGGMDASAGAASVEADGHYLEFLDAIEGKGPVYEATHSRCFADVEYSAPLMEGILIGCVAQQVPGKLKWNSKKWCFDNEAANALIGYKPRKGFEF